MMIEYVYYDPKDEGGPISESRYLSFLELYYGTNAIQRLKRVHWYSNRGDYRLLLALKDGELVGQSSAYRVMVYLQGHVLDLWWGVDAFVLESVRGLGIGKGLQKQLHQDLTNFSSLEYSRTNGIVKRKCGAKELIRIPFNYLPINSFLSILVRVATNRLLHKNIVIPKVFKNKYFYANRLLYRRKFIVKDVDVHQVIMRLSSNLMEQALNHNDFYVLRDEKYLYWKYIDNPTIGEVRVLEFSKNGSDKLCGCIIFSAPHNKKVFSIDVRVITILDCLIFDESLSKNDMLIEAIEYYEDEIIDGVMYIGNISYFPRICYPSKGRVFLSTYETNVMINKPYFAYSDQDMEQVL